MRNVFNIFLFGLLGLIVSLLIWDRYFRTHYQTQIFTGDAYLIWSPVNITFPRNGFNGRIRFPHYGDNGLKWDDDLKSVEVTEQGKINLAEYVGREMGLPPETLKIEYRDKSSSNENTLMMRQSHGKDVTHCLMYFSITDEIPKFEKRYKRQIIRTTQNSYETFVRGSVFRPISGEERRYGSIVIKGNTLQYLYDFESDCNRREFFESLDNIQASN